MSTQSADFGKQFALGGSSSTPAVASKPKIRRGNWVVTVPMAAVAVAYVTLFFLPGRKAVDELRSQIKLKRDCVAQASGLAAMLQFQQQQLDQAKAYGAAWRERAPLVEERSALEGKIHALAEAAGVTTTRFNPEAIIPHETIKEVPVAIECNGTFAQVCTFLGSLESLPLPIWINSTAMEKIDATTEYVKCEITVVVFTDNPNNSDYAEDSE